MSGNAELLRIMAAAALLTVASFTPDAARAQQVDWSEYMDYPTVTRHVQDWVGTHPEIATVESIGQSHEGRDLWLVTVTNRETGEAEAKPALYVQGGMDSDEVMATQAAMYLLHRVLEGYGEDPEITRLVDTRTLYLLPNLIPDQSELFFNTPKRVRDSTTRPYDNDFDGAIDEDDQDDIDGDGKILQMRVEDPAGEWKTDPDDPRVMLRRAPADGPSDGPFYRLYPTEGIDNDGDGEFNEDPVGGVDPNRNWPAHWAQEYQQDWSGPYPLSEVENQHLIRFFLDHSNIGAIVDLHTSGNLLYRPSSVYPDEQMELADLTAYRGLGERYTELTDGPVITPLQRARERGARGVYGSGIMIDWAYDHLGALSFAPELWNFPVDEDATEQLDASESERIDWAIRNLGREVWADWHPVQHPQLGTVELGGWNKPMPNNPVGPHVERIASEITEWMLHLWSALPLLEIETDTERLDERTWQVRVTAKNVGYLPTNVTDRAKTVESVHPLFLSVEPAPGLEIIGIGGAPQAHRGGKTGVMIGHLGGWGTADQPRSASVAITVADQSGSGAPPPLTVVIDGQRAGIVRRTIDLAATGDVREFPD